MTGLVFFAVYLLRGGAPIVRFLRITTVHTYLPRVPQCLSPRRDWDPQPHKRVCPSPPPQPSRGGGGGAHTPEGGGGGPNGGGGKKN
jgi:hypothetical protein